MSQLTYPMASKKMDNDIVPSEEVVDSENSMYNKLSECAEIEDGTKVNIYGVCNYCFIFSLCTNRIPSTVTLYNRY